MVSARPDARTLSFASSKTDFSNAAEGFVKFANENFDAESFCAEINGDGSLVRFPYYIKIAVPVKITEHPAFHLCRLFIIQFSF